jgi:formylmethanofuran dehydrogenase subunit E
MNKESFMETQNLLPDDFKRCVEFHGHMCGGLAMGYQASKAALAWLKAHRAMDEELVAIVENDACGVDAVQVLTGCTFGKGNFIFHDYGKMAFTFFSRKTGKGVRLAPKLRPDSGISDQLRALFEKKESKTATDEDLALIDALGEKRAMETLTLPVADLFTVSETTVPLPPKAQIKPSLVCYRCGEPAMATKMETVDGQPVCRGCLAKAS